VIRPIPLAAPVRNGGAPPGSKVALVTLGCAKNLVDSEIMAGLLARGGFTLTPDVEEAEVAVVNTCAFIGPSQKESIDRILEVAALKREGKVRALVVAGCMAQRYQADLMREIPEVDAVVGTGQVDAIARVAHRARQGERALVEVGPPGTAVDLAAHRAVSTPRHLAYLRIADGCDFRCTFCIIPRLRGDLRSRPFESVVEEARRLAASGAKELLLIAQDSTSYGEDLYDRARLPELLRALAAIDGIEWLRVHYTHPKTWSEELIRVFEEEGKVCRYVDIPLQHVTDRMLRRMRREVRREEQERRDRADHLEPEQQKSPPQKEAAEQAKADQRLPDGKDRDGGRRPEQTQGERFDGPRGEVLCRAQPREELERAKPEEDQSQADPQERDSVSGHPGS